VQLTAVVQMRAQNEDAARQVVLSPLDLPSNEEIKKTNEINLALNMIATITDVFFSVEEGPARPVKIDGKRVKQEHLRDDRVLLIPQSGRPTMVPERCLNGWQSFKDFFEVRL
jgi:hypothetical protein